MKREESRQWRQAARMWGVQTDFMNADKEVQKLPLENLRKVLRDIVGTDLAKADATTLIAKAREKKIFAGLEPVKVVKNGRISFSVYRREEHFSELEFFIKTEEGPILAFHPRKSRVRKEYNTSQGRYLRLHFQTEVDLKPGYHTLQVRGGDKIYDCLLIVPPPGPQKPCQKLQGVFAPLYAIHSQKSWGIGDLRDLLEIQRRLHPWGVDFFGVLPLLSAYYEGPYKDISPYSPCSKLFWNEIFLYIPDLIAEGFELPSEIQLEIEKLNSLADVDYDAVFKLKKSILMALSRDFFAGPLPKDYQNYLKEKSLIQEYANFRARGSEEERHYHLFVQYHMDRQMRQLDKNLYLDFPVGVNSQGFDTSYYADCFIKNMNVGAPPDLFYKKGQNWGFAPLHPARLREHHYHYFIETLRHHMSMAKVLRLDHVMALHRLYVIPQGQAADQGSYIRYQGDEMFAIVALEASRSGVHVVGENLGTVPDRVHEYLKEDGIAGMWLMVFEGGKTPTQALARVPEKDLICFSTHDMLPFAGHIEENNISAWQKDFFEKSPGTLLAKMFEKMAQSPAELFLINIEDLWLEKRPQNIPGHSDHPNWRRKLKYSLEEWTQNTDNENFVRHLSHLRKQRRPHGNATEVRRPVPL